MNTPSPRPPRLLDRVCEAIRSRHYSPRTEKAYLGWTRRYVVFHGRRHPAEMGAAEITQFLSALATHGRVSASTQNQAFSGLLFLHREVLGRELGEVAGVVRAKRPVRLPLVLSREDVEAVLGRMRGTPRLMASLLYGAGLRLLECCRLRVKDIDFGRREITVRDGKGRKDRVTLLPARLAEPLRAHLDRLRRPHELDRFDQALQKRTSGLGASLGTRLLRPAASKQWVVYSKAPLSGPAQVLRYLGRYTHRIAIGNERWLALKEGRVTLRYRDRSRGNAAKLLTLEAAELVHRFLLHVLPRGFVRVRHFGLQANPSRSRLIARARQLLHAPSPPQPDNTHRESWQDLYRRLPGRDPTRCPTATAVSSASSPSLLSTRTR